jgi:hypothetical protein
VGKAANAAIAGRARTRQRAVGTGVDDAARERRLSDAADAVHQAREAIEAARERAALAIAAARALERDEVAAATARLNDGVRRASAERLTVAQVAELVGLPAPEVRRILRTTAQPEDDPSGGPGADAH